MIIFVNTGVSSLRFSRLKFIVFFILASLITKGVVGQDEQAMAEVTWSELNKSPKLLSFNHFLGCVDDQIYALCTKKETVLGNVPAEISSYDVNTQEIIYKQLVSNSGQKKLNYNGTIQLKNGFIILSSDKDRKSKTNTLYRQSINKEDMIVENAMEMAKIDYGGYLKSNSGDFDHVLSRDSTKLLIYYNLPYDSRAPEKFGFQVFDESLEALWQMEVTLPYTEDLFEVVDYKIDSKGGVHLLGILYKDKKEASKKGEPNYTYHILSYLNGGSEVKEYPLTVSGTFLTDMRIAVDNNDNLICAGFYSEEGEGKSNKYSSIKGSYAVRIDQKSKTIVAENMKDFELDFIVENRSEEVEEGIRKSAVIGENVEMDNFHLDDLVITDDGTALLLGEKHYTRNSSDNTFYIYRDVLVVAIAPSGDIKWHIKIKKGNYIQ
jgi:hypothetical protein